MFRIFAHSLVDEIRLPSDDPGPLEIGDQPPRLGDHLIHLLNCLLESADQLVVFPQYVEFIAQSAPQKAPVLLRNFRHHHERQQPIRLVECLRDQERHDRHLGDVEFEVAHRRA